ncbi:MAG: DUF29 family protein [Thermosynechococcus sp.]
MTFPIKTKTASLYLKVKYWDTEQEYCLRRWQQEVMNFRSPIQEILEANPSLTSFVQEIFVISQWAKTLSQRQWGESTFDS